MAEQIRYDQQLQRLNLQNVDFVAERENVGRFEALARGVEKMANFAFGMAESSAKIEGAEYGAETAPTTQQIIDAYSSGEKIELPGDKFSVYGAAARAAAMDSVKDDISLLAKQQILQELTIAERQNLDPADFQNRFNTMIDGYASILDDTSPSLAKSLRADLGLYAYAKVSTESSQFLKSFNKQKKAQVVTDVNLFLEDGLRTLMFGLTGEQEVQDDGTIKQISSGPEIIKKMIAGEKSKMLKSLITFHASPKQIEDIANVYDAKVDKMQENIIVEEMLKQGNENRHAFYQNVLRAVESGENSQIAERLPPSVYNALFAADTENKQKILARLQTSWTSIANDREKEINFNEKIRQEEVRKSRNTMLRTLINFSELTDPDQKSLAYQAAIDNLQVIRRFDPDNFQKSKEMIDQIANPDGVQFGFTDNQTVVLNFEIDRLSNNPTKTTNDIIDAAKAGEITFATFKSLLEKYENIYDENIREAMRLIKGEVGAPADLYIDGTWAKSNKGNFVAEFMQEINTGKRNDQDGTFNAIQYFYDNKERLKQKYKIEIKPTDTEPNQVSLDYSVQTPVASTALKNFKLTGTMEFDKLDKLIKNRSKEFSNNSNSSNLALLQAALDDREYLMNISKN